MSTAGLQEYLGLFSGILLVGFGGGGDLKQQTELGFCASKRFYLEAAASETGARMCAVAVRSVRVHFSSAVPLPFGSCKVMYSFPRD